MSLRLPERPVRDNKTRRRAGATTCSPPLVPLLLLLLLLRRPPRRHHDVHEQQAGVQHAPHPARAEVHPPAHQLRGPPESLPARPAGEPGRKRNRFGVQAGQVGYPRPLPSPSLPQCGLEERAASAPFPLQCLSRSGFPGIDQGDRVGFGVSSLDPTGGNLPGLPRNADPRPAFIQPLGEAKGWESYKVPARCSFSFGGLEPQRDARVLKDLAECCWTIPLPQLYPLVPRAHNLLSLFQAPGPEKTF